MFDSLKKILPALERQPGWEEYLKYRQVLKFWQKTVASATAQHARPIYFKKDILWVATSSSVWAQELSFQRYSLLKTLNSKLAFVIKDLRFSTALWQKTTNEHNEVAKSSLKLFQPSDREIINNTPSQEPQVAVREWLKFIQARSEFLPLCPHCSVPTPEAELQRWQQCYHCYAKEKFAAYRQVSTDNKD